MINSKIGRKDKHISWRKKSWKQPGCNSNFGACRRYAIFTLHITSQTGQRMVSRLSFWRNL